MSNLSSEIELIDIVDDDVGPEFAITDEVDEGVGQNPQTLCNLALVEGVLDQKDDPERGRGYLVKYKVSDIPAWVYRSMLGKGLAAYRAWESIRGSGYWVRRKKAKRDRLRRDEVPDEWLCGYCCDLPKAVTFIPCTCLYLCHPCYQRMRKNLQAKDEPVVCPLCFKDIKRIQKSTIR